MTDGLLDRATVLDRVAGIRLFGPEVIERLRRGERVPLAPDDDLGRYGVALVVDAVTGIEMPPAMVEALVDVAEALEVIELYLSRRDEP